MIEQGGAYLNDKRLDDSSLVITLDDFKKEDNAIDLRVGKKKFHRIKIT